MSAPLPIACADNRDGTEREKDRANNISIPRPSEDCAEQRQAGEQKKVARFIVHSHFPIRKGQQPSCPSPVRELMALNRMKTMPPRQHGRPSFWERPSRALPDRDSPPRGSRILAQS